MIANAVSLTQFEYERVQNVGNAIANEGAEVCSRIQRPRAEEQLPTTKSGTVPVVNRPDNLFDLATGMWRSLDPDKRALIGAAPTNASPLLLSNFTSLCIVTAVMEETVVITRAAKQVRMCSLQLADESRAYVTLTLWEDKCNWTHRGNFKGSVASGDIVVITGLSTNVFQERACLRVTSRATCTIVARQGTPLSEAVEVGGSEDPPVASAANTTPGVSACSEYSRPYVSWLIHSTAGRAVLSSVLQWECQSWPGLINSISRAGQDASAPMPLKRAGVPSSAPLCTPTGPFLFSTDQVAAHVESGAGALARDRGAWAQARTDSLLSLLCRVLNVTECSGAEGCYDVLTPTGPVSLQRVHVALSPLASPSATMTMVLWCFASAPRRGASASRPSGIGHSYSPSAAIEAYKRLVGRMRTCARAGSPIAVTRLLPGRSPLDLLCGGHVAAAYGEHLVLNSTPGTAVLRLPSSSALPNTFLGAASAAGLFASGTGTEQGCGAFAGTVTHGSFQGLTQIGLTQLGALTQRHSVSQAQAALELSQVREACVVEGTSLQDVLSQAQNTVQSLHQQVVIVFPARITAWVVPQANVGLQIEAHNIDSTSGGGSAPVCTPFSPLKSQPAAVAVQGFALPSDSADCTRSMLRVVCSACGATLYRPHSDAHSRGKATPVFACTLCPTEMSHEKDASQGPCWEFAPLWLRLDSSCVPLTVNSSPQLHSGTHVWVLVSSEVLYATLLAGDRTGLGPEQVAHAVSAAMAGGDVAGQGRREGQPDPVSRRVFSLLCSILHPHNGRVKVSLVTSAAALFIEREGGIGLGREPKASRGSRAGAAGDMGPNYNALPVLDETLGALRLVDAEW